MPRTAKNILLCLFILLFCALDAGTIFYLKSHSADQAKTEIQKVVEETTGILDNVKPLEAQENANAKEEVKAEETKTDETKEEVKAEDSETEDTKAGTTKKDGNLISQEEKTQIENSLINLLKIENNNQTELNLVFYALLGTESLILAMLILYLIMSGFNKKTLSETFRSGEKISVYILAAIILTSGFIALNFYLINNLII